METDALDSITSPRSVRYTSDPLKYFCGIFLLDCVVIRIGFVFQTIALLNIYRNPQNTAQSADGISKSRSYAQPNIHRNKEHPGVTGVVIVTDCMCLHSFIRCCQ